MNTENKITSPEDILKLMSNIDYGYVNNKYEKVRNISDKIFEHDYQIQSPVELVESKIGVCWDQCELERFYFQKYLQVPFKIYYMEAKNLSQSTHTLLVYEDALKFFWFENSWFIYRGIHEFNNMDDLFKKVSENHLNSVNAECDDKTNEVNWHLLEKPEFGIDSTSFMNHAKKQPPVFTFIKNN